MTNQSVVGPDVMLAALASISNSPLFPNAAVRESMALLGGFLNLSQRKLTMKGFEFDGDNDDEAGNNNNNNNKGGRAKVVNTWIDSMRASSPTRAKSTALTAADNQENNSWILYHPSALNMFDQIIYSMKGKQIVTFLDYDGTLSPIVADPDKAFMSRKMRATLKDIANHFPTAIVTGRCRDKVFNFVKLAEVYYAGSHGMDIKGPTKSPSAQKGNDKAVLCQPASKFLPMIEEVYKILLEKTKSVPGAKVENNKFCLSVHFRCVDEKCWAALAEQVRVVLNDYPKLKLTQGRKVLEIRPTIKWDKGNALQFLLASLGYENSNDVFPIYIGDDRTDEDAFKVLRSRSQGMGILVSRVPKDTAAAYTLKDPSEVEQFLRRLVDWKRSNNTSVTPSSV